jgi:ferric-dicitrate binding protein FerR (iron transport regulator)
VIRQATEGHLKKDQRLAFELPSGQAAIHFRSSAPAHEVRLTTPHARIRLTGTWVLVSADPAATQVDVLEGSAAVTHLVTGQSVQLLAGDRARVQPGHVTVQPIPVEEWLTRKGVIGSAGDLSEDPVNLGEPSALPPLWHEAE